MRENVILQNATADTAIKTIPTSSLKNLNRFYAYPLPIGENLLAFSI